MSAATGIPEDERCQPIVTPSEAEGSKALGPQSSWRLRFLDCARKDDFHAGDVRTAQPLARYPRPTLPHIRRLFKGIGQL